tara:strand:- start:32664 stop:32804 length:141 start_codon:yes stop_codon:yes gene_type:complete
MDVSEDVDLDPNQYPPNVNAAKRPRVRNKFLVFIMVLFISVYVKRL